MTHLEQSLKLLVGAVQRKVVELLLRESRIVAKEGQPKSIYILVILESSVVQIFLDHGQCSLQDEESVSVEIQIGLSTFHRVFLLDFLEHNAHDTDQQLCQGTSYQLFIVICRQKGA